MINIKKIITLVCVTCICVTTCTLNSKVHAIDEKDKDNIFIVTGEEKIQRISGKDRFETCINVAKKLSSRNGEEKFKNIIISSAFGFADSLSGSVLAKKLNAPIILVGNDLNTSKKLTDYVKNNIEEKGNIYILGGVGAVKSDIENSMKNSGYTVKRLSGKDRFSTCNSIVKEFSAKKNTPFVIVNGFNFADALSISAPASIKGYPILLSGKDSLPLYAKDAIKKFDPSEIFIIGGNGVLSKNIDGEIKKINLNTKITRISGKDRYDTSLKVNQFFNNNESILLASGKNYPDALSGSALAGNINSSLLLVDDSSIKNQIKFIDKDKTEEIIMLGGTGAISSKIQKLVQDIFK